jgi:hypothetical protein
MNGYVSPGQAAARGIVAGTEMGLRVQRQQMLEDEVAKRDAERAEDREWTRKERVRQTEQQALTDERTAQDREYTDGKRLLEAVTAEETQLAAAVGQLTQQYGSRDRIPPDVQEQFKVKQNDVLARKREAERRLYEPIVERTRKKSKEILGKLERGEISLDDVPPAELARSIVGATGFKIQDFTSGRVRQGAELVTRGLESGDEESLIEGANIILEPELRVGVGSDGPDGTKIVGKKIVKMIPTPDGQGAIPVIEVTVRAPDGRTGTYLAPPTEGRGMDPKSRVTSIDPAKAMDRIGRLLTLDKILSHPGLRERVEAGAKEIEPETNDFFTGAALIKAPTGKFTTSDTNLGGTVRQTTRNESGIVVGERDLPKTATPDTVARGIRVSGAAAARPDLRVEEVEETDPETGETRVVTRYVRIPRSGGAAEPVVNKDGTPVRAPSRATSSPKGPSENEIKGAEERAKRETARREGLQWDENARGWINIKTKRPATPEQIERIEAAAAEASKAAPAGKPKVDVAAERARAEAAIKAGKKPELVKALFQERTGQKYD